jgi:hypothetical protein
LNGLSVWPHTWHNWHTSSRPRQHQWMGCKCQLQRIFVQADKILCPPEHSFSVQYL